MRNCTKMGYDKIVDRIGTARKWKAAGDSRDETAVQRIEGERWEGREGVGLSSVGRGLYED